jgi:hypothetical protein
MSATVLIQNPTGGHFVALDEKEEKDIETGPESTEDVLMEVYNFLDREATVVQYVCFIETVNNLAFLMFIPSAGILFASCISYIGYIGARQLNTSLVRVHLGWEIILCIARVYSLVVFYTDLYNVHYLVNFLGTLFQFVLTYINYNFLKNLIEFKNNVSDEVM